MSLALPRSVMPARPYKYAPRSTMAPAPAVITPNQGVLLQPVAPAPKKEKKNYLVLSSVALLGVAATVAGLYAWRTHKGGEAAENAVRKARPHGGDDHVHGADCPPDCGE